MGTSVAEWTAQRTDVDTHPAEGLPETPETPVAEPVTPAAETPPAGSEAAPAVLSPSDTAVAALVKGGMPEEEAKKLIAGISPQTPKQVQEELEAFLDGKPHPVPKNLTFKLKSGTQTVEKTLAQLQSEGMLQTDYQRKTMSLAQERREHARQVAEWTARDAALKEREKWFEEQRNEMLQAQKDPQKWEEYQEVLRLRAQNPTFNKLYEDAMRAREDGAQRGVFEKAMEQRQVGDGVEQALEWITEIGKSFPGVDPERVRLLYSRHLESGTFPENTEENVRKVYAGEMEYLKGGPAAQEAAALKARIEALEAAKGAENHNAHTARVLERGKAISTAPVGGAPAALSKMPERKPIVGRQAIEDKISEWSRVRE